MGLYTLTFQLSKNVLSVAGTTKDDIKHFLWMHVCCDKDQETLSQIVWEGLLDKYLWM